MSVTLLGYLLDPFDPDAGDAQIVARLLKGLGPGRVDDLVRTTETLGGRWVLIADDGARVWLFHDAIGLRQVFFSDPELVGSIWCASQPSLLAETLGLSRDPETETAYAHSTVYSEDPEHTWPGDTCVYGEIRHLLPNHRLDLNTGACLRYWPDRPIGRRSLEDGVESAAALLTALIRGAARRFPLALAMTAGWDTRLILAASRSVASDLYYYTLYRADNQPDVTTAPRLLARLNLTHHMVRFPDRMDPEFEAIYKRNVTEAHDFWGRMANALFDVYPEGRVSVTGNAAEIVRRAFRLPPGEAVTGRSIAPFTSEAHRFRERLETNRYVVAAWDRWLEGLGDLHGVDVLDLFYWEHRGGNFSAAGESEWDIVQEAFTPYNCRTLLTTMLSVDESHRELYEPELYRLLIRKLWPEVLREPINEPYEGFLTPLLRVARRTEVNRLVPAELKRRLRRMIGIG